MDLLRRIWSSIRPTATVWSVDAEGHRPADLKQAIGPILLPDLLAIVVAYAVDLRRYSWPTIRTASVLTNDGEASSVASSVGTGRWRRLVATQSIGVDGPRRWRLRTEYASSCFGYIAVGISRAPAGLTILDGTSWPGAATMDDVLVRTSRSDADPIRQAMARIYHAGFSAATDCLLSNELDTITLIDFDAARQTMTVTFYGKTISLVGRSVRQIQIVLPQSTSTIWRPCVTFSDDVMATLLAWPDDVAIPSVIKPFRIVL